MSEMPHISKSRPPPFLTARQLALPSVYWTNEVEDALRGGTIADYAQQLAQQILALVERIRQGLTKAAPSARAPRHSPVLRSTAGKL